MPLNCAALSEGILESGSSVTKGAFTSATYTHKGRFQAMKHVVSR